MKKIHRIEPVLPAIQKQKKVAAYARVSKDTERLMNLMELNLKSRLKAHYFKKGEIKRWQKA